MSQQTLFSMFYSFLYNRETKIFYLNYIFSSIFISINTETLTYFLIIFNKINFNFIYIFFIINKSIVFIFL